MPEGYIRGKPDIGFWTQQIYSGVEFRKKYAREDSWSRWREYYRGQWRPGTLPHNLFFSMLRTIVPRVYFRNPSVSVSPAMPGTDVMAFAAVLQRADNKQFSRMSVKREMKRSIQDAFLFGTGVTKLGFGAQFTPTPQWGETSEPISEKGERFEYRDDVFQNMPWFSRIHPRDFIVPDGLSTFQDARWIGHWVKRPLADVIADPRFTDKSGLEPTSRSIGTGTSLPYRTSPSDRNYVDMIDLVELRDKKFNTVMVFSPYRTAKSAGSRLLYFDEDEFTINGAFPTFPLVFNEDDEFFWGIPDAAILEPYQLEANEIRTQAMKHRRLALIKMIVDKNNIDDPEIEKMMSELVNAVVKVDGNPRDIVVPTQISQIPVDLRAEMEAVLKDVRETVGFSRNQFGEYNPGSSDTTATEANIVRMASEIRVDERRDMVADMLVAVVESMHTLMFTHWDIEQIVDVIGPGGVPVWVKFKPSMLRTGQYTVKVDPDSAVPETKQIREARAAQVYALLKSNPLIDPYKLTQFLLSELGGVQFDDMMRMLPMLQNGMGAMGSPMGLDSFVQALPAQIQAMQQAAQGRQQSRQQRPQQRSQPTPRPNGGIRPLGGA